MDARLECLRVYSHCKKGICNRQGVRPSLFGRAREFGDVCHIRRELYDERPHGSSPNDADQVTGEVGTLTENHSSVFGIWARDIQFIGCDALTYVQFIDDFCVFVLGKAKHIYDDCAPGFSQKRHFVSDKAIDADIFQSDGVEHSGWCREQPRWEVTVDRPGGSSFYTNAADPPQICKACELFTVPKSSARSDHRVVEVNAGQFSREIHGMYHNVGYNFGPPCL